VSAFAAVWSATYWVLGTKYDAYAVLWGCLVDADATKRKFKSQSPGRFTDMQKGRQGRQGRHGGACPER
jgi:hypothetical protein